MFSACIYSTCICGWILIWGNQREWAVWMQASRKHNHCHPAFVQCSSGNTFRKYSQRHLRWKGGYMKMQNESRLPPRTDRCPSRGSSANIFVKGIKEGRSHIPSSWLQTASSQNVLLSDTYTAQSLHSYQLWKQDVCGRDQGASSRTLRPHRPVEW